MICLRENTVGDAGTNDEQPNNDALWFRFWLDLCRPLLRVHLRQSWRNGPLFYTLSLSLRCVCLVWIITIESHTEQTRSMDSKEQLIIQQDNNVDIHSQQQNTTQLFALSPSPSHSFSSTELYLASHSISGRGRNNN